MFVHLLTPVYQEADIPFEEYALVRRHGIWEQHGAATSRTVHVLDDMLAGSQNGSVGYQFTHRPSDIDSVANHVRAAVKRFQSELGIFTSDFKKAFKQVPNWERLINCTVVTQWDPMRQAPAFFLV